MSLQLFTYCHSEKTENLATSVDFRLIQNLLMLIEIKVSLLGWKAQPTDILRNKIYFRAERAISPRALVP